MSKHTAGPWRIEFPSCVVDNLHEPMNPVVYEDQCGDPVANICGNPWDDITDANARLIAAAPDLLEQLRWFMDDLKAKHSSMVEFDRRVVLARAAIAKAEA